MNVIQFRVELRNIAPPIWREIEVPGSYTFWDLHVAIQDAMGWLDYHLHVFLPIDDHNDDGRWEIGIPVDDELIGAVEDRGRSVIVASVRALARIGGAYWQFRVGAGVS